MRPFLALIWEERAHLDQVDADVMSVPVVYTASGGLQNVVLSLILRPTCSYEAFFDMPTL
jgi:hypothetical protein